MANDALILFVIMLGCVLITAVICWMVWGRACNALEIELTTVRRATEHELGDLSERCAELELSNSHNADELGRSNEEREALEKRCGELSRELKDVTGQLADAKGQLVDLRLDSEDGQGRPAQAATGGQGRAEFEAEMQSRVAGIQSELADLIIDRDDWRGRYETLESEFRHHGHGANAEELKHLREKLAESLDRVAHLERRSETTADAPEPEPLLEIEPEPEPEPEPPPVPPPPPPPDPRELTLARIAERSGNLDLERLGLCDASEADDLTKIKGVGPFVERKLNALGVFSYAQIARFTATDEDQINDAIEFFPGRVRRDDWTGQARKLLEAADLPDSE